jgi:hypothetical protein
VISPLLVRALDQSVSLYVCLSVCQSVCMSVSQSVKQAMQQCAMRNGSAKRARDKRRRPRCCLSLSVGPSLFALRTVLDTSLAPQKPITYDAIQRGLSNLWPVQGWCQSVSGTVGLCTRWYSSKVLEARIQVISSTSGMSKAAGPPCSR